KGNHPEVRADWLALTREDIIEPALPIVDTHHHLWARPWSTYLAPQLLADIETGHRVVATVFMECRSQYRQTGPAELMPVGETEFVRSVAAEARHAGRPAICAGIA